MSTKIINFHFKREEGRPIVLTSASEGSKYPSAAVAMARILDTIKKLNHKAGPEVDGFKKFTATLICPTGSTNCSLKIVRDDQRVQINLRLKRETAELLANESTALITPAKDRSASHTSRNEIPDANQSESAPLLNQASSLPTQRAWIKDIFSRLLYSLSSFVSILFCGRSRAEDAVENEPATLRLSADVRYVEGIRTLPKGGSLSFINSILQAVMHALPSEVRLNLVDAHQKVEKNIRQELEQMSEEEKSQPNSNDLRAVKNRYLAYHGASSSFIQAMKSYPESGTVQLSKLRGFIENSSTHAQEDACELLDRLLGPLLSYTAAKSEEPPSAPIIKRDDREVLRRYAEQKLPHLQGESLDTLQETLLIQPLDLSAQAQPQESNYALRLDLPKEGRVNLQELLGKNPKYLTEDWGFIQLQRFPLGKKGPKLETSVELPENNKLKIGSHEYEIETLVLHEGNAVSGEYYDYIRKDDTWYAVKDGKPITELEEFPENASNRVYLIFLKKAPEPQASLLE